MRLTLLAATWLCISSIHAQVKIGEAGSPDVNAVLELASTNKGLLLPRLNLTSTASFAPMTAHKAGIIIYNSATAADVTPGYYINDGAKWVRLGMSGDAWNKTGNAATVPATDFIGTTDAQDLVFRTNNVERLRLLTNGDILFGSSALPGEARLKIGGGVAGMSAAGISSDAVISATANGDQLYGIRNRPVFSNGGFTPSTVYGDITDISYSGSATNFMVGTGGFVSLNGGNYAGTNAGIYGYISRNSSGASDGNFYGGYFRSHIQSVAAGSIQTMYGVRTEVTNVGTGASSVASIGGISNTVLQANENATSGSMYGILNDLNITQGTLSTIYGTYNDIELSRPVSNVYGLVSDIGFATGGTITNGYGAYITGALAGMTNYRGIFIANFSGTSGIKRVFEYNGTGANDPVVINYDGSVGIGTSTLPTNAKLSVVDGHIQSGQTTKPTILASANIGTGGIASLNDATDVAGIISLDFGSGAWGSGAIATITFNKTYAVTPIVTLTPTNGNAALSQRDYGVYVTAGTTGFTINFLNPVTAGFVHTFSYHVIETVNN